MSAPAPALAPVRLADAFVADVVSPYKPNCRYLKSAWVEPDDGAPPWSPADGWIPGTPALARFRGEFSIPESCYIDDTGHFNAVEFNICFNQFFYVALAHCVVARLLPAPPPMTYAEYRRRQLPDVLIHEFHSVFKKPLQRSRFEGRFVFTGAADRREFTLFKTRARFWDACGGACHGEVTLVLANHGQLPQETAAAAGA